MTAPLTQPHLRPRELEDWLNFRIYHPLSWRLALLLARTPITPNMVSVIGGACVVAAGIAYAHPEYWPISTLIGMALHMIWHVVDGADGDLARITGRASPIGEMVDGACDYLSHTVLYLILGWLLARQIGGWGWLLAVAAGISHAVQANHVEVQRRSYQYWVYDKPWLRHTHDGEGSATRRHGLGTLVGIYLKVAAATSTGAALVDAAVARSDGDPPARAAIRAAARAKAAPLLRPLEVLGPNPRAIILGLSMLAGSPAWYFLWLVAALNPLMVWSIAAHERAARRILAQVG